MWRVKPKIFINGVWGQKLDETFSYKPNSWDQKLTLNLLKFRLYSFFVQRSSPVTMSIDGQNQGLVL